MRTARFGLLLLGALILAPAARAAHITDKMAVGLYDSPGDKTPGRVLSSGTPLEILGRRGRLCKVRLGNGDGGWLECRYVTDEKPARVMLLEAQARTSRLRDQLAGLRQQLNVKQQRLKELEKRIEECMVSEQGAGLISVALGSAERVEIERPKGDAQKQWDLEEPLPALLGAVGGFALGALLFFWRCRRRFGG